MAIIDNKQAIRLDQYDTTPAAAGLCCDWLRHKINIKEYQVIEPAAGTGVWLPYLPEDTIAFDVLPRSEQVNKQDFLLWWPTEQTDYVVVGNPPYGRAGRLIKKFIERSFQYALYCAFLLPHSYRFPRAAGAVNRKLFQAERVDSLEVPNPYKNIQHAYASFVLYRFREGWSEPKYEVATSTFRVGSLRTCRKEQTWHGYDPTLMAIAVNGRNGRVEERGVYRAKTFVPRCGNCHIIQPYNARHLSIIKEEIDKIDLSGILEYSGIGRVHVFMPEYFLRLDRRIVEITQTASV